MLTLARIDKINIAIRCTAFSNLHAVNVSKQVLHGNCTGMKRNFGRQHVGPTVAREALRGCRDELSRRMGELDSS